MSYGIDLQYPAEEQPCDHCGGTGRVMVAAEVDFWWNYTSNCAGMWRQAGADLAAFDGDPAGECAPLLRAAIEVMESEPATFRAMNPPNGWGDYDDVLEELKRLLKGLEEYPDAIVRVSR